MDSFGDPAFESLLLNFQQKYNQKDKITRDIDLLFRKFTKLMERKCVIFWHIRHLETYLLKNINPFGLKVQILTCKYT